MKATEIKLGPDSTSIELRLQAVSCAVAADFRKGEKTREEITDLMAGGETMATLEAELQSYMDSHGGHAPKVTT